MTCMTRAVTYGVGPPEPARGERCHHIRREPAGLELGGCLLCAAAYRAPAHSVADVVRYSSATAVV
eukprot:1215282-Prymnesium_polylepis.1